MTTITINATETEVSLAARGNDDDTLLMGRIAQGDKGAFDKLAAKHRDHIEALAQRYARDFELAKEVAVEAWVRVYRSAHTYRGDSTFLAWLTRIVINTATDACRRRARHSGLTYEEAFGSLEFMELSVEDPHWEEPFREQEVAPCEAAIVRNLIDQMEPLKRDLLLMTYRDEFSYDQIVAELAIPLGTVKSRLSRARGELRRDFQRTCMDSGRLIPC